MSLQRSQGEAGRRGALGVLVCNLGAPDACADCCEGQKYSVQLRHPPPQGMGLVFLSCYLTGEQEEEEITWVTGEAGPPS